VLIETLKLLILKGLREVLTTILKIILI